jgi:site-specific DNA-methyltransferase (adenine-specific)
MLDLFTATDGLAVHANDRACAVFGDCLDALARIKPASVDLIFADPPYGIGKDFGVSKDRWPSTDSYLAWCRDWIGACMRALKPDGTMYLMAATQTMPALDCYVAEAYHVLGRIVWAYDSSGVQPRRRFGSAYEPILMFTHSARSRHIFNAEDVAVPARTGSERGLIDYRRTPPAPYNSVKIPGNVWFFPRVRYKMPEYENHPTQKPEALLERIVRASSREGDIVLDPFSGSFTTAAVALRLHRRAVGIDISEEYYKIGLRRLGLADAYDGAPLAKDLSRKTANKNKADHSRGG